MHTSRNALTPEALQMMDTIARTGSFAAAARELGKVPSALTYNVRQLEDALDVLLFDRKSGQAKLTAAGDELLAEGRRLLAETEAVANRVRRVSSGWESSLCVVAENVISRATVLDLCEAFYGVKTLDGEPHGTRLQLRFEVLAGAWEAVLTGTADLAIGVVVDAVPLPLGVSVETIGEMSFVFAVAPHHPLAAVEGPLGDDELLRHRTIAVSDSSRNLARLTYNVLPGQDVLRVPDLTTKIEAQLRGLGCGFIPEMAARPHIDAGRLVVKHLQRGRPSARMGYAWRSTSTPQAKKAPQGLALAWWLEQMERPATRRALLERHAAAAPTY
jgi:DNA-binding transcriptional LysR family regulator